MNATQLYDHLWDFARHRVITVAARSGMLGLLAGRAATAGEMAAELGLDLLACGKLTRALCALGLVEARGESYRLSADLCELFTPGDGDLTPFIEHTHRMYESWGLGLDDWLRSGKHVRGRRSEEQLALFGRAMKAASGLIAARVVSALDGLAGVERVLDIGGGVGGYSAVFCRVRPSLQATVLDVPEVAELGRREIAGTKLEDQITFQDGDYHEADFGSGYDMVLLANVLHIEKTEAAADLVRRAAGALVAGGRLCVVDFEIDERKQERVLGALFAINMRSFGDTHTEPTIRSWLEQAGIEELKVEELPPAHWLIWGRLKQ
ncbi:MAG TPA: methyltransferase [Myxococcota bacterium]|nr:methyltransferase [Myxococcota bacterium]